MTIDLELRDKVIIEALLGAQRTLSKGLGP